VQQGRKTKTTVLFKQHEQTATVTAKLRSISTYTTCKAVNAGHSPLDRSEESVAGPLVASELSVLQHSKLRHVYYYGY
jgi:hypothetical protein